MKQYKVLLDIKDEETLMSGSPMTLGEVLAKSLGKPDHNDYRIVQAIITESGLHSMTVIMINENGGVSETYTLEEIGVEEEESNLCAYVPNSTVMNGVPVSDKMKEVIQDAINGQRDSVRYNYNRLLGYPDAKKVAYMAPSGNVTVVSVKELRTGLFEILSGNPEA